MPDKKKADFLFINKSPSSASLSNEWADKPFKLQVYGHVQRNRDLDEERRNRAAPKIKPKAVSQGYVPSPTPWQVHPYNTEFEAGRHSFRHSSLPTPVGISPKSADSATYKIPSRPRRRSCHNTSALPSWEEDRQTRRRKAPSLIKRVPKNATTDPFNATPIPLDDKNVPIFRYFETQMFPAVTRQDSPNFVNSFQFNARQVVEDCGADPLHLYALLAGACARIKCVSYNDFQEPDIPDMCQLFVTWACERRTQVGSVRASKDSPDLTTIRALSVVYNHRSYKLLKVIHDTINSGDPRIVDHRLIQSLYFIWTMESYRRNWDAVTQIRRYLFFLCNRYLNGIGGLTSHLQKMLYFADRFHAHATDDVPFIQAPFQVPKLSMYQWDTITNAIQSAGEQLMGSSMLSYSPHFSGDFKNRMEEMSQLACVLQCHWRPNIAESILSSKISQRVQDHVPILPDREWVMKSTYNLSDRLLYEKPKRDTKATVQEFIRVALIAWLAFITVPTTGISAASPSGASPTVPKNSNPAHFNVRVTVRVDSLQKQFQASRSSSCEESPGSRNSGQASETASKQEPPVAQLRCLLLWAAGLGVLACGELKCNESTNRQYDDLEDLSGDDIQFFRREFVCLARQMNVTSWAQFEDMMKGFPWLTKLEQAQKWRLTRILNDLWKPPLIKRDSSSA